MFTPISLSNSTILSAIALPSPVTLPPNAIVHYDKITGPAVRNPNTGNYEVPTSDLDIPAIVRDERNSELLGTDARYAEELFLTGFLKPDKKEDLAGLDFSETCQMTLFALNGRPGKVKGAFTFVVKPHPLEAAVDIVVGVPIEGVLVLSNSGEVSR